MKRLVSIVPVTSSAQTGTRLRRSYEESAQLVDAVGMIGMLVRVEHRIDHADIVIEHLLAQIGRGVDQYASFAVRSRLPNQERTSPAAILGVGGIALPPMIADARYAAG